MKKKVGRPTLPKSTSVKSNAFKANPSKTLRPNAKKPSYTKHKRRTTRTYSGPADYDNYYEPSLAQNGAEADNGDSLAEADRAAASPAQGASFFSFFGGIDGIISMMGKANQVFKLFQQMGPMFKMIGSFTSPKAATASLRPGQFRQAKRRPRTRR